MTRVEASVAMGQPLSNCTVVSCHTHLGVGWNHPIHGSDAPTMVRTMDRVGIAASCVSSMRSLGPDLEGGNADIADIVRAMPDRFLGAVVVNPHFPEESRAQLDEHFASGLFGMIKIHPEFHVYPMDGPGYASTFAFAEQRRIPILTHSWGFGRGLDHPSLATNVARSYPSVPFILGHAGGTPEGVRASVAVASEAPSIYLDTATSQVYRGAIEYMVESLGPDRVVFGTDASYLADAPQVARVAGSRIDEGAKLDILGGNLLALLRATRLNLASAWVT